jgi:hypothetical protein
MNSEEKIEYVKKLIIEESKLNPYCHFTLNIKDYSANDNTILCSKDDIQKILNKFSVEGYIDGLEIYDDDNITKAQIMIFPSDFMPRKNKISFNKVDKTIKNNDIKINLLEKDKKGYVKISTKNKNDEFILIGKIMTRKFKLLKVLMDPSDIIGLFKNVDVVFNAIRLLKDKNNSKLNDPKTKVNEQMSIIGYTITEIQKIKKLQGIINFNFSANRKELSINIIE